MDKKDKEKEIEKETQDLPAEEDSEKVKALEARIEELEKQVEEERNAKLRFAADCQNIKARAQKEKEELLYFSQTALLLKVLDIVDDFKNIIESGGNREDDWYKGIEMVYNKLIDIIKSEGVEVIDVKEQDVFNPIMHEAVGSITVNNDDESQKIVKIVSLGYKRIDNDSVIRTAKVIVTKKE